MSNVLIQLENQLLTIQNKEIIASGAVNVDTCIFGFDANWKDYIKTGVFYQDKKQVYYGVLDGENKCTIPAPAIEKSAPLYIGVFGVKGNKILTSSVDSVAIVEGAISGQKIDMEPSETVFASIVANYQAILEAITVQNEKLTHANILLETLNAYDVVKVNEKLDAMEEKVVSIKLLAENILNRETILRNVPVKFVEGVCKVANEFVNSNCLCDVYFDEYSYEIASNALIQAVSYDGYLDITCSKQINEELTANIIVRGY